MIHTGACRYGAQAAPLCVNAGCNGHSVDNKQANHPSCHIVLIYLNVSSMITRCSLGVPHWSRSATALGSKRRGQFNSDFWARINPSLQIYTSLSVDIIISICSMWFIMPLSDTLLSAGDVKGATN
jgi:hypothetical protein